MTIRFQPLNQRTAPDEIFRLLREAILTGALSPGSQLREAHISADMGVSRAPLREALTRLEEDGLVVKIPFRGAFVAEVSSTTMDEIAALRCVVEPYAAELAAPTLRDRGGARLSSVVRALRVATSAGEIPASIDAHLHFHRLFYECSGNAVLGDLWAGWESKLRLYLVADHRSYQHLEELAVAHEGLAELALRGDGDKFRAELAAHVRTHDVLDEATR